MSKILSSNLLANVFSCPFISIGPEGLFEGFKTKDIKRLHFIRGVRREAYHVNSMLPSFQQDIKSDMALVAIQNQQESSSR